MLRLLLSSALTLAAPAKASDLSCVPDRICVSEGCDPPIGALSAIQLKNIDSVAPTLLSRGETIAMAKTFERTGLSEWSGVNAAGETENLWLSRDWMVFVHSVGGEFVPKVGREVRYKASGKCEVQ